MAQDSTKYTCDCSCEQDTPQAVVDQILPEMKKYIQKLIGLKETLVETVVLDKILSSASVYMSPFRMY